MNSFIPALSMALLATLLQAMPASAVQLDVVVEPACLVGGANIDVKTSEGGELMGSARVACGGRTAITLPAGEYTVEARAGSCRSYERPIFLQQAEEMSFDLGGPLKLRVRFDRPDLEQVRWLLWSESDARVLGEPAVVDQEPEEQEGLQDVVFSGLCPGDYHLEAMAADGVPITERSISVCQDSTLLVQLHPPRLKASVEESWSCSTLPGGGASLLPLLVLGLALASGLRKR